MDVPQLQVLSPGVWLVREVDHEVGLVRVVLTRQQFGARLSERPVEDSRVVGRFWCYQTLPAAVLAGSLWDGGETSEPVGYWRRGGGPLAVTWQRA